MIEDMMQKIDVQVHEIPHRVIYYKNKILQTLSLEDERLNLYPVKRLSYVEGLLRHKGFRLEAKWKVVECIYAYKLNILLFQERGLSKVKRNDPSRGAQPKIT